MCSPFNKEKLGGIGSGKNGVMLQYLIESHASLFGIINQKERSDNL